MTSDAGTYEFAATTRPKLNSVLGTPWRYRCPDEDCRSTTVIVREQRGTTGEHKEALQPASLPQELHDPRDPHIHQFLCNQCSNVFDEPFDTKEGECHLVHEM